MLKKKIKGFGNYCLAITLLFSLLNYGVSDDVKSRVGKLFPVFQVVKFANDFCTGTSYNGTCYTAAECSSKGGYNEGSCASGFGVCCSIRMSCGSSSTENGSYLIQSSATSISTNPCKYEICPLSKSICRIRYDFSTFVIASQITFTAVETVPSTNAGPSQQVGSCLTDTFNIAAPGSDGSPVICGTNSGYHMILDSNGVDCHQALFNIGKSTTTTRSWNIRVNQYICGEEDSAGPPGCLQYYSETSNTFANFGFPTSYTGTAALSDSTTHLTNQHYYICIRRASGYCYICYTSLYTSSTATNSNSFGLSISQVTTAPDTKSEVGTDCAGDYIEIPGGGAIATVSPATQGAFAANTQAHTYCGRFLSNTGGLENPGVFTTSGALTVCTKDAPFKIGVHFDESEVCSANTSEQTCEYKEIPGGIIGFKLRYWQVAC